MVSSLVTPPGRVLLRADIILAIRNSP